ncbi:hypothetical protein ADUPG1_005465, partial [Aduncisulcus paluster]
MVNFCRDFIPNCSTLTAPLSELTHKTKDFEWTDAHTECFYKILELLKTAPPLSFIDDQKDTGIYTDASDYGVGGVVLQVDRNGRR